MDRGTISDAFLNSDERFTNRILLSYLQFLKRPADNGGLNFFLQQLRAGAGLDFVALNMLGSPEYFQRA